MNYVLFYKQKYVKGLINLIPSFNKGTPIKDKTKVNDKKIPTIRKRNPNSIPIHSQNANKRIRFKITIYLNLKTKRTIKQHNRY